MKQVYAYSYIIRNPKGKLTHAINHCWAHSQQEARGIAEEEFEQAYPDSEMASILIRKIDTDLSDGDNSGNLPVEEFSRANTRIKPEFKLPNSLA